MPRPGESSRAVSRWLARAIPAAMLCVFGVGSYAVVWRCCVRYVARVRGRPGLAAGLVVLYLVFLVLALAAYLRTLLATQLDPGLVPLVHGLEPDDKQPPGPRRRRRRRGRDAEASPWVPPDANPDSPGLEAFYSKDVFACEADGRPKWCSDCRQWKPDRAHHSSELGRCVRKMDHVCPWVGGMVSETSFNFFFQFTLYATCLCAVAVAAGAYCLGEQTGRGLVDGWAVAVVALASTFGFFTMAMTLTSARFICTNMTNVDMLRRAHASYLAVRIPRDSPPTDAFPTVLYPLPRPSAPAAPSARDRRAVRRFAILRAEPRENPWDLGPRRNWRAVMGTNAAEWLLPIRHSPCCDHESMESDYPPGPLLARLKERYGVPELGNDVSGEVEMHGTTT